MNEGKHIHSAYDRDLEAIQAMVVRMGGLVEQAIKDGAKALETHDVELSGKVVAGDRAIDELEEKVVEEATRTIALRAPVSQDLRLILSVIRFAGSLERVGDYAKNISKRNQALVEQGHVSETDYALRRMSREVQQMLRDVLDAFVRRDVALAYEIRTRDEEVDQMYTALFRQFLTLMMEDPRRITACMHLHFVAKNLERIGDLVTNLAEQVIYIVEGEMPDERRPKGDRTAYLSA